MNKAQQLIIAAACGFPADHEMITDALSEPNDILAFVLLETTMIDKETLFSACLNGKSIFEYKEIWNNLEKLDALLGRNGEKLTYDDFSRIVTADKTLAELANENDSLPAVFAPALWEGHRKEMEDLWFSLPKTIRKEHDFSVMRRTVAAAEGITLREDQLAAMGIPADDVHSALKTGKQDKLEEIVQKLAAQGDHLRKEDLLLMDDDGETIFETRMTWKNFENLLAVLKENGETLTVEDYLFSRSDNFTPIGRAMGFDMLDKVFTPQLWQDDPNSMIALFKCMPGEYQDKVDLSAILSTINQDLYGSWFKEAAARSAAHLMNRKELTAVLNPADPVERAITPLGLYTTWENMDTVIALLEIANEKITGTDLRTPGSPDADNYLMIAAHFKHFATALQILQDSNEQITLGDLTDKNSRGVSVMDILVKHNQIDQILDPALWTGHGDDLLALLDKLPDSVKLTVDKQKIIAEINRQSLRDRFLKPQNNPPQPQP